MHIRFHDRGGDTRTYIERINIRGNTRTRDYVIRREFDIGEGDAYNRALSSRAERRLKVQLLQGGEDHTTSLVLRLIVSSSMSTWRSNQPAISLSGGYSTSDGFLAEVSVAERNLLGRGLMGESGGSNTANTQEDSKSRWSIRTFLGYRVAFGVDVFGKQQDPTQLMISYHDENNWLWRPAWICTSARISPCRRDIRFIARRSRFLSLLQ